MICGTDAVSQSLGGSMLLGGVFPLVLSGLSLFPSKMEQLRDTFVSRRAGGMGDAELVRLTEADWREAARVGHDRRIVLGGVEVALGAACVAVGAALILAPPGFANMDRDKQYTVGSALVGPGLPVLALGLRSLLLPAPEEIGWGVHRAARGLARAPVPLPSLGLGAVRGGGEAVVGVSF